MSRRPALPFSLGVFVIAALATTAHADDAARGISFVNDVLPVLSKAGCNAGSCHAKPEG